MVAERLKTGLTAQPVFQCPKGCGRLVRRCLCGFTSCTKRPKHIDTNRWECEPDN